MGPTQQQQLSVTLAEMPQEAFAAMLGRHMLEYHVDATTAAVTETKAPELKPVSADKK